MHSLIEQMISNFVSTATTTDRLASFSRGDSYEDLSNLFSHIEDQTLDGNVVPNGFSYHMAQPRCWAIEGSPANILEVAARFGLVGGVIVRKTKTYVIWPDIHYIK
jgi:hypothetical protein